MHLTSRGDEKLRPDLAGLVDRIDATVEAAKSCNSFSGIGDDTDGDVKFICRTDSVEGK